MTLGVEAWGLSPSDLPQDPLFVSLGRALVAGGRKKRLTGVPVSLSSPSPRQRSRR